MRKICYNNLKYTVIGCCALSLMTGGLIMSENTNKVEKSLHINQDVIAQIITNSITEIDGVYGVAPVMKTPRQIWLRQESMGNIRIGLVDDVLSVSIGVILNNGTNAIAAAEQIQEQIKSSVQTMLGLTVAKVNVTVCGVHFTE